jgi:nucleotide-binding universal stress UspA family protein
VKRILVALDASDRAARVLETAAKLAALAGAKLVLYRAVHVSPDLPRAALSETDARLEDFLTRNAHRDLEQLASTIAPSLVEQIATSFAVPWDGICGTARERDVDLVVIGSHGYGGLDRLLGTTASKVVNHCDRNVLVVRTVL